MSALLREIKTVRDEEKASVCSILGDAAKAGLVSAIVVGLDENQTIHTFRSGLPSRLMFLGALEYAKKEVLE